MDIGFIGLGNMGAPMATNLEAAGHNITGFDIVASPLDGIDMAASAAAAAKDRDIVITMLPDGAILQAVAAEILPVMRAGSCFIDCSTVDVAATMAVSAAADAAKILCLDAPVSGGVGGASAGTLTFMVGGSDAGFARAAPLFDIMGQRHIHCGSNGAGQAAKICNNMILGVTMIASCEAIALADKLGLDRQKLFDVVSTSSGYSWSMNAYCPAPGVGPPSPADNDYKPGFSAALMLKDLCLATDAAKTVGANAATADLATKIYRDFAASQDPQNIDFSAILKTMTTP
jgi:3-hydroxyisobutyrate dehydrogenase